MVSSTEKVNGEATEKHSRIVMMESTFLIRRKVTVSLYGLQGIFTLVSTRTMKEMGMARCSGLMVVGIRVSGSKESKMAMER